MLAMSSTDSNLMSGATRTFERKMSLICFTKASERFSLPMRICIWSVPSEFVNTSTI